MAWRLIVETVIDKSGIRKALGVVTDDQEKLPAAFPFRSLADLTAQGRALVAAHEAVEAGKGEVFEGMEIDLTPPKPAIPPGPTKEEQARAAFFADYRAYRQQMEFDALPDDLKARCLPEYVGAM